MHPHQNQHPYPHAPSTAAMALALSMAAAAWLCGPPTSHAQEVYRCGDSYSSTPCHGGRAVSIAPWLEAHTDSSSTQHVQRHRDASRPNREAQAWERTERELDKAQAATAPQRQPRTSTNRSQCQAKQQRIQKIDDLARRGGSVQQMERLREERQTARDWQFRAGC